MFSVLSTFSLVILILRLWGGWLCMGNCVELLNEFIRPDQPAHSLISRPKAVVLLFGMVAAQPLGVVEHVPRALCHELE